MDQLLIDHDVYLSSYKMCLFHFKQYILLKKDVTVAQTLDLLHNMTEYINLQDRGNALIRPSDMWIRVATFSYCKQYRTISNYTVDSEIFARSKFCGSGVLGMFAELYFCGSRPSPYT